MKTRKTTRTASAFTLIELLVVIAIMVVVAGLVVGLTGVAGDRKKVTRTQVERDRLVTLIENYKAQIGVYPPSNPDRNKPHLNTLFYELAGGLRDNISPGNPNYTTRFTTPNMVSSNVLNSVFGATGVINAQGGGSEMKLILKDVRSDQTNSIVPGTVSFVVPVDGPNGKPNPWNYLVGEHAVHNKESFDLWAEIVVGRKQGTNVIKVIGNWKD